jgi:hypothetical protein
VGFREPYQGDQDTKGLARPCPAFMANVPARGIHEGFDGGLHGFGGFDMDSFTLRQNL